MTTSIISPLYATDHLAASKLHVVDVDGIATRYYEDGVGVPLVLFAGGQIGSLYTIDSYSLNLDALARHFRVIAVDKLGQGGTAGPLRDADYTWEATVAHAKRFIEILGLKGAHLAGHSRGGMLIPSLAYELPPGTVKSLVIIDSGTLAPTDPTTATGAFYATVPHYDEPEREVRAEPLAQAFKTQQITSDFMDRMLAHAKSAEYARITAKMNAGALDTFLTSLDKAHDMILAKIAAEGLPVPVLMLWDYNDKSAPVRWAPPLLDVIAPKTSWTELHIFNEGGHYTFRENPEQFNRVVTGFCQHVDAAVRA